MYFYIYIEIYILNHYFCYCYYGYCFYYFNLGLYIITCFKVTMNYLKNCILKCTLHKNLKIRSLFCSKFLFFGLGVKYDMDIPLSAFVRFTVCV